MRRKFILSTDPLSNAEEVALSENLRALGCGWWHWLPNFWLVIDANDKVEAASIRDAVKKTNDYARAFVARVDNIQWTALTKPDAKGNNMAEWLKSEWGQ